MNVIGAAILAGFALASGAHAAAEPGGGLRGASKAFDEAQFRHDVNTLDRLLATDFKFVRGSGKLTDRADFIEGFADREVIFEPFAITNRIFVDLGANAGVVGGEAVIRGTDHGRRFEEHFRYADTFRRRNGRWEVAYVQVTPLK